MQNIWKINTKIIHEIWCEKSAKKGGGGGGRVLRRPPQEHYKFKDPTEVNYLKKKTHK